MVAGHLQEKSGYYYAVLSYRDETGKRKTKWMATGLPTKGNKKRAESKLMELRKSFVPPVPLETKTGGGMLFADFLKQWVEVTKCTIKPTTYASYYSLLKNPIVPYFRQAGTTLIDLCPLDIQTFYSHELERVSANTVIHYHAVMNRALKYAVKVDLIPINPVEKVERPRKNHFHANFYDGDEIGQLFQVVEGKEIELPVKLAAFYGLRRSEIIGLRWSDIDFNKNTICIQHTVTNCVIDGKRIDIASDTTKTKSSMRTLPLVPVFKELLLMKQAEQEEYKRLCGRSYNKEYLNYVCVNQLGVRMNSHYLSTAFPKFLEQHGMRKIRFHDLRHSCASLMLSNGVAMKQIQEWLGHSDFSTTANIYAHLEYQSKLSAADAMLNGLGMTVLSDYSQGYSSSEWHQKKPSKPSV